MQTCLPFATRPHIFQDEPAEQIANLLLSTSFTSQFLVSNPLKQNENREMPGKRWMGVKNSSPSAIVSPLLAVTFIPG